MMHTVPSPSKIGGYSLERFIRKDADVESSEALGHPKIMTDDNEAEYG